MPNDPLRVSQIAPTITERRSLGVVAMMLSSYVAGFLSAQGYAPSSRQQRTTVLRSFIATVGDMPADQLTQAHVLAWWATLDDLSPATRKSYLGAVRTFCAHLRHLGVLTDDPTALISRPVIPHRPPIALTPHEVLAVLTAIDHPRDRAAATLMLGCGLRGGDVARIDRENVDLDAAMLRVTVKGGRERLIPMPAFTVTAVRELIEWGAIESGPLMRNPAGRRIQAHTLRCRLTRAIERAGAKSHPLDGRASHVLRRTCATSLLRAGASVFEVQSVLGHDSLSSTQRYLAEVQAGELRAVVERGPLAGLEAS